MITFIAGLVIGALFIGAPAGFFVAALCVAAREGDRVGSAGCQDGRASR